jgi:RimJ/RimL family protein N-acetyltransferase/glycosyltransferase involved in cell wall biosynthesis
MFNILIRQLSIEDASISFHWRNDPEIWQYTGNRPDKFVTEDLERNWLTEKLTEKNSSLFAIIVDNKYVGNIQITDIIERCKGQYHIFIGEKSFWGKGVGTQATAQIIRFAKEKLNLKELYLIVNPNNEAAIKLYEKSGFVKVNNEIRMTLDLVCSKPSVVSVFVMAYNQEQFIAQALEGIIMQKTNFDFDIVVGEDCSTDNTRNIVLEYANKYPGKFKLLLHEHNVGAMANQIAILNACTGKYIAMCEGDDYWTDQNKLQKQIDFLESNPEFSLCFHNALVKHDGVEGKDHLFCDENVKEVTIIEDVIAKWYIPSVAMVFRKDLISSFPDWLKSIYNGDYALQLLLAYRGKVEYINEVMSVYRKNAGALSVGIGKNFVFVNNKIIELFKYFNIHSNFIYSDNIEKRILQIEKENRYLEIRKKYPVYKYLNTEIWISKIKSIIR